MTNVFSRRLLLVSILLAISVGEAHCTWGDDYVDPHDNTMLKENHEQTGIYVFLISRDLQSA